MSGGGPLTETERTALAEAAYRREYAHARVAMSPWSGLADFQREHKRNPFVERVVLDILAARGVSPAPPTEALAAVEALCDLWEGWAKERTSPRIDAFRDAAEQIRAALAAVPVSPAPPTEPAEWAALWGRGWAADGIYHAALSHAIECYGGPDDDTVPVLRVWLDAAARAAQPDGGAS